MSNVWFVPVSFVDNQVMIPVNFKSDSPKYEGQHSPFWISRHELTHRDHTILMMRNTEQNPITQIVKAR